MSHSDVFVIGAGPAGLTAAYLLTKQGISTTVIEADPTYVGGISRTAELQGLPVRHRRPPLLLQVEGGGRPVDRRSCPTTSSSARACRASTTTATSSPTRSRPSRRSTTSASSRSALCVLSFLQKQAFPTRQPRELPRLGRQPVRRAPVQHLLQDLHREGVGHELRRDLGRLGRAAHQGPRSVERHVERAAQLAAALDHVEEGRPADQDADRVASSTRARAPA